MESFSYGLDLRQAAARLSVSTVMVRKLLREGKLKRSPFAGKKIVISNLEIERVLISDHSREKISA